MNFQTAYPHGIEATRNVDLYRAPGSQAYFDTTVSLPYLSLLSQPSDSYAGKPYSSCTAPLGHLEAITDDILPRDNSDPLGPFFAAKRGFLAGSVADILSLIYEREQLKYDNLRKIDYDSAKQKTRLFEIDSWRTGANPQIDKTRAQIDRELLSFEREKRFEDVACWRDITRLRGELREAVREFSQEKRKESLLGGYEV